MPMANERILFMKPRSEVSMQLYKLMLERDYPEEFCDIITKNLNTDWAEPLIKKMESKLNIDTVKELGYDPNEYEVIEND